MRMYRLADGVNAEGWPFLLDGHAYLADGTPLTECDRHGRIVPAFKTITMSKATDWDSLAWIAVRANAIEALAGALNDRDAVRAPLLLLHLQIDSSAPIVKYNHFHKPAGPGGGQFASGPGAGGRSSSNSEFHDVAQSLHVDVNSTWVNGIYGPEIDKAHADALLMVWMAITATGRLGYKPGIPGYGQELDTALELLVKTLPAPLNSMFQVKPVYLGGVLQPEPGQILPGASVPDLVYGPPGHPLIIFELKTGRAALNLNDAEIVEQKRRTLINAPDSPIYEYFQVYEK